MKVGDVILQKHQKDAPPRLVVAATDDPEIVVVHDPELGYRKVHVWAHDVIAPASGDTEREARERISTKEYAETISRPHW